MLYYRPKRGEPTEHGPRPPQPNKPLGFCLFGWFFAFFKTESHSTVATANPDLPAGAAGQVSRWLSSEIPIEQGEQWLAR